MEASAMKHMPGQLTQACGEECQTYRIAFLNTHPIQYFAPLYSYLGKNCNIEATALYLSDFSLKGGVDPGFRHSVTWDIDLLEGYEARFVGGAAASRRRLGGFFSMIAPQLWGEIRSGRFDAVVVHGHNLLAHHIAVAACLSSRTPVFTRGETHLQLTRTRWRAALRRPLLKMHYSMLDGFLAIGSGNAAYYREMGVDESRIFHMPYSVDNERFMSAARRTADSREATRRALGIERDTPAILFAAKFDHRKRPDDLLAAFAKLQSEGIDAQLVYVGTGMLEEQLRQRVASDRIRNVTFSGFVNQRDLPSVYAACDVFVLPSSNEPWGLAVNEAMCAGLPIVLSREIGCAMDLVADGVNGATFNAGDVKGLAEALRLILVDPERRAAYGKASLERIRNWSYRECGIGLRTAIAATHARRTDGLSQRNPAQS